MTLPCCFHILAEGKIVLKIVVPDNEISLWMFWG